MTIEVAVRYLKFTHEHGLHDCLLNLQTLVFVCVWTGNFPNLENDVEEGICQVIAHIWLRSELEFRSSRKTATANATANPNTNTNTNANANLSYSAASKRLGEFFLHQIETDASPVYGDGFRSAYAAASKYGLVKTLAHLRKTGRILG